MDGWKTCSFVTLLSVFQLYQNKGRVIIKLKGCVQGNPANSLKAFPAVMGFEFGPLAVQARA